MIHDSSVVRITFLSIDGIAAIPQNRDLPFEGSMFFLLVATLLSWGLWSAFGRPKTAFLPDFATLLDRPEFVHGLENTLAKRAFLKGEFRGRKVVVLLQNGRGEYSRNLVVSMETRAPVTMESYAFTGYRSDREGELALFALEVKHEFMLRHEEGCLKARWAPQKVTSLFNFDFSVPANFDTQKCQSVLEAMHTLAGSIERRAGALSQAKPGAPTSAAPDAI
jgi:hypothetical protein